MKKKKADKTSNIATSMEVAAEVTDIALDISEIVNDVGETDTDFDIGDIFEAFLDFFSNLFGD